MKKRWTNAVVCMGTLAILVVMSPLASAGLITSTKDLPPDGVYLSTEIHEVYAGAALDFLLTLPEHKPIAEEVQRRKEANGDEIEIFPSVLNAQVEVLDKSGNTVMAPFPVQMTGMVQTTVKGYHLATTPGVGTFQTEIVALSLTMPNPLGATLPDVSLQIMPSPGEVTVTDLGNGMWEIDSFFDVFTELSIDTGGGLEVLLGSSNSTGGARMDLVPEPGTFALLAVGLLGLLGYFWRRKRAG